MNVLPRRSCPEQSFVTFHFQTNHRGKKLHDLFQHKHRRRHFLNFYFLGQIYFLLLNNDVHRMSSRSVPVTWRGLDLNFYTLVRTSVLVWCVVNQRQQALTAERCLQQGSCCWGGHQPDSNRSREAWWNSTVLYDIQGFVCHQEKNLTQ